jgi:tetratricopeptide (TPR) repeat protein
MALASIKRQTSMHRRASMTLTGLLLVLSLVATACPACAQTLDPPVDPTQSITYWKPQVISAARDPEVARAHAVFEVLLRAWDRTRLAPCLYVVDAAASLWAASLADGSILLTRSALHTILGFGPQRGEHLLAFVLAHELAHQRSDDLWHQRFFRLIGNQDPELSKQMATTLTPETELLADREEKEAQADHDGLLMMASVGYDPYQIVDRKDFFTAWIENSWQATCPPEAVVSGSQAGASPLAAACRQALTRSRRTRAQLKAVAAQATLYTMGVQAFVAGRYADARHYFSVYGRSYTNRAVLYATGLTHFCEALESQKRLRGYGALARPDFYYPLLLDASPPMPGSGLNDTTAKRSPDTTVADAAVIEREQQRKALSLAHAVELFEKAIRLAPEQPKSYLMLAYSYLLGDNPYMVKGIVRGKYIPRFGQDLAATLILAMTAATEGSYDTARKLLSAVYKGQQRVADPSQHRRPGGFPEDLLTYAAYHNGAALAAYLGQADEARRLWQTLAQQAKSSGNGLLFRLALNRLEIETPATETISMAPTVAGLRLGDRFNGPDARPLQSDPFWIEGEPYRMWRLADGIHIVVGPEATVVSAWRNAGPACLTDRLAIGDEADRPMTVLGMPDRRLHLLAGEFWAYDAYGVAVRIENQKVAGWFLYTPR